MKRLKGRRGQGTKYRRETPRRNQGSRRWALQKERLQESGEEGGIRNCRAIRKTCMEGSNGRPVASDSGYRTNLVKQGDKEVGNTA